MAMEVAVFTDCRKLIETFVENDNTSFDSFCDKWKSMDFQHIYAAQTSMIEIVQTTKLILHLAKRLVAGRSSCGFLIHYSYERKHEIRKHTLRRLAALYLMYAIYFKQPTKLYVKIEVSKQTWFEINNFVQSISTEVEHAAFILWKLKKEGAFRFTESDYYLGLDNILNYDSLEKYDQISISGSQQKYPPAILELQKITPSLVELEQKYNQLKQELSAADASINHQTLPETSIFQKVQTVFNGIAKLNTNQVTEKKEALNRREIRQKAFKNTTSNVAAVPDTASSESNDSEPDNEKSNTRAPRRMSAITVFSEPLSKQLLNELCTDKRK